MKKKHRRILQILFWVAIAIGAAWVAFAPKPKPHHNVPKQIEVTQPSPPPKPLAPQGDELTQPPPANAIIAPLVPVPEPKAPTGYKGKPRIAIVIDDMGLDLVGSRRAVALPPFITLSYIPYATRLNEQTKDARGAGHELLLHMPMQPMGGADPGPGALLVGLPSEELRQRLDTALASFTGFDGINNHMGSKFTADADGMGIVMDELQQRHLFFLDSRTTTQTVGAKLAQERGLPSISRDVFLDDEISVKAVRAQLDLAEHVAKRKGSAVAIGHPHAATLQALAEWIPEAEKRGFVFVPIKDMVNQ